MGVAWGSTTGIVSAGSAGFVAAGVAEGWAVGFVGRMSLTELQPAAMTTHEVRTKAETWILCMLTPENLEATLRS